MAERSKWDYVDENKVPQANKPITAQGFEWGSDAAVSKFYDPNARQLDIPASAPRTDGWINQTPYGDEHNFLWRLNSLLLAELERRGVLFWSEITNYDVPGIVWASDNSLYRCKTASGPETIGAKNPTSEPEFWERIEFLPPDFINGFVTYQDFPGSEYITFGIGEATAQNNQTVKLLSPLVKFIGGLWAPGNNKPGDFFSGSPSEGDFYHLFVIKNPVTGQTDVGFDDNITADNRPSEYTLYRRVASLLYGYLSSHWDYFTVNEIGGGSLKIEYDRRYRDYFSSSGATSRLLIPLRVPPEIKPIAHFHASYRSVSGTTSEVSALITAVNFLDLPPETYNFTLYLPARNAGGASEIKSCIVSLDIIVDTNQNIAFRQSASGLAELSIFTSGYTDRRVDVG